MRKTSMAAAAALVATLAAPGAFAADTTEALRVVRDRDSGEIRAATREEMKAMQEAERAERKARGLPEQAEPQPVQVRQHADGMRVATLGPDFLISVVAAKDKDGKLVVEHANPADEHVAAPAADTQPTE